MIDESTLYRILERIAVKRGFDIENDHIVRRAMALVVMRNRGLTTLSGRKKI